MFCLEYDRNQKQAKKHDYTCPGRLLCMHRYLAGLEFLHFINEDGVIFCLILSLQQTLTKDWYHMVICRGCMEADSSSILSMAIKASSSASASSNDADFWESSYSIPIRSPVEHTHTKHISTSVHAGFLVTLIHKMPWLSQDQTGLFHWKYLFGWIHVQFSLVTHYLLVKYF